jgi:hypothetical protein
LAINRDAELDGEPERSDDLLLKVGRECHAGSALDHLGDHPRRRRKMPLQPGTGPVRQPPLGERLQSLVPVQHLGVPERRERKAGGVGEHLFDGDTLFSVGGELGDDLGNPLARVEQAVANQLPDDPGHDGAAGGLEDVAHLRCGVAERFECDKLAVMGDCHLARREQAGCHFEPHPARQHVEAPRIDRHHRMLNTADESPLSWRRGIGR